MFTVSRMDREPARSAQHVDTSGRDLLWLLDVVGEYGQRIGRLALRTSGDLKTGRLQADGGAIVFPSDEE